MPCSHSQLVSFSSVTVSNASLISNAKAVSTSLFSHALSTSYVRVAAASTADRPGIAPKFKGLISRDFRVISASLQATILSNTFLKHDSRAIKRYERRRCRGRFSGLGKTQSIAFLNARR